MRPAPDGTGAHEHRIPSPPPGLRAWLLPHPHRARGEPVVRRRLAGLWGVAETEVAIGRGEHGRPYLRAPRPDLDLGWSHSGERLLLVLAPGQRLGVDLEWRRPRPRAMDLARRFYHPEETAWLLSLPQARREAAFVRLWCAKEAVLKAHGQGISFGLHRLRFVLDAGGLAGAEAAAAPAVSNAGDSSADDPVADTAGRLRLVEADPRLGDPAAWQLREWAPAPGYRAALAWGPPGG